MPLTWQNVAAPDFSGAIAAQRNAGASLNDGFGGFQNALSTFEANRLAAQKYADDKSMNDAKFADDHSRNLLGNESVRLGNVGLAEANSQTAWQNQNTKSYEASRPAAVDLVNQIRSYAADGTPEGKAKSAELQRSGSSVFAAAGWTPENVNAQITGNIAAANSGLASKDAFTASGDAGVVRSTRLASEAKLNEVLQVAPNAEAAARMIRADSGLDAKVAGGTLDLIGKNAALWAPAADPNSVIMDQRIAEQQAASRNPTARIAYDNQKSTRNDPLSDKLTGSIAPVLDQYNVTMKVFSGGQETANEVKAGKGNRTGSIRHDHGGAGDVEFYAADGHKLDPKNPADLPILTGIVQGGMARGITGWGEGDDYMGSGRIHLGFGTKAVWGKDGDSNNAPEWLRSAYAGGRVSNAFADTLPGDTPAANPAADALARAAQASDAAVVADQAQVNQGLALTKSAADANQALLDRSLAQQSQAQTLIDTTTASAAFNKDSYLVDTLMNRPDKGLDRNAVIEKLVKEVGDDDGLTRDQMADELDMVMGMGGGMAPDVAAGFIRDSVNQTTFGARWLYGKRAIYKDKIEERVNQLYGNGPEQNKNLQGAVSRIQQSRTAAESAKLISGQVAAVEKAKQDYFTALERKNSGRKVDVDSLRKRYEMAQDAVDRALKKAAGNPLNSASANSRTGQ